MEKPNSDKKEQEPEEQQEQEEQEQPEETGETEIDVSKIIENTETPEDQEDNKEKEEEEEEGFGTAINNAFGRILTIDLEPEKEKTENLRIQLKGLAEDVRLGRNANRFLQKYVFTDEESDPKTALIGSTISALALAVAIRPELVGKIKSKIKGEQS